MAYAEKGKLNAGTTASIPRKYLAEHIRLDAESTLIDRDVNVSQLIN